ncbi:MAG: hypothetical protein ACOY9D_07220 [Pseudomonadota bacterium]
MNSRKFEVAVLALLLTLSSSPGRATHLPDSTPGIKTVVATVGARQITREDIIHMILIEKFYKSPPLSEADALFNIMQDAIAQEVAHSVGVDVTPSETPLNSPFVDQYTPAGKEDIKTQALIPPHEQTFHVDQLAYAQLYVVPKMIDRKLRRYYNTSSFLHRKERERISQALQLAVAGKSFAEAANQTGLITARHELEDKKIELPAALAPALPVDKHLPRKSTLFEILNQLAPGELHPDILQDEDGYRVLRLIARNGPRYTIETIEAARPSFESWLKERSSKLDITIGDDALKREVQRDYSGVNWVGRL